MAIGWEKLYTIDGVPFWTNHNERTTSWDPPPSVAVDVVSEAQVVHQPSLDFSNLESVDETAQGVTVQHGYQHKHLGPDGRPLPEGERHPNLRRLKLHLHVGRSCGKLM